MKIKLVPISTLLNCCNSNLVCLDVNSTIFEPERLTRRRLKKALDLLEKDNINNICAIILEKGARKHIISESCSFKNRIILINARKCNPKEGCRGFVVSPFSDEKFFDDYFHFEKGGIF